MNLLKVKDGLLEEDNFYLTSSFSDFAGKSLISRDIGTNKLKLISNNLIERKFNYNEFVIDLNKENFKNMNIGDYSMLYLGNNKHTFGIKDEKNIENINPQNKYWRILKRDNYIQSYSSNDGINYENIGGMEFNESITKQGFQKFCDEDFILKNYKVYENPYVTILNFNENYICEVYDKYNNLIKTRKFDTNMECKIFIENIFIGFIIIRDENDNRIFQSDLIKFSFGDIYINSPYLFEIKYNNKIITTQDYGVLKSYKEKVTIKNKDIKDYQNIVITTQNDNNDVIELSLDNKKYNKELIINEFKSNEEKEIYVRILKENNINYYTRSFQLFVNKG